MKTVTRQLAWLLALPFLIAAAPASQPATQPSDAVAIGQILQVKDENGKMVVGLRMLQIYIGDRVMFLNDQGRPTMFFDLKKMTVLKPGRGLSSLDQLKEKAEASRKETAGLIVAMREEPAKRMKFEIDPKFEVIAEDGKIKLKCEAYVVEADTEPIDASLGDRLFAVVELSELLYAKPTDLPFTKIEMHRILHDRHLFAREIRIPTPGPNGEKYTTISSMVWQNISDSDRVKLSAHMDDIERVTKPASQPTSEKN